MTVRRLSTVVVCAAGLAVSGCGGGSAARPPITLNGVAYSAPQGATTGFAIRESTGGTGAQFGDVIYIEDGLGELLVQQTAGSTSSGTVVYQVNSNNFAVTRLPGGDPDFDDLRFLRLVYVAGSTVYGSDGVIGRFTPLSKMGLASGTAIYTGTDTAEIVGLVTGGAEFELEGDATVSVAFGGVGSVDVVLDKFTAVRGSAPLTRVEINDSTITGNRFGGGTIRFLNGTDEVFTGGTRDSGGIFAGWNDGNGANTPAEVGGAFTASGTTGGVASGRYAAD